MAEDIKDYGEQLKQLCHNCKRLAKCKDLNKICAFKKFAWNIAKVMKKRREKGAN